MKSVSRTIKDSLLRTLLLTGLACLSSCQTEDEGFLDTTPEVIGKTSSALTSTHFDFIANAPSAAWSNNDGGVPWGTFNDPRGACYQNTIRLEDNIVQPCLITKPKVATDGFVRGAYTVTIPSAALNPSLTATFGFLANQPSTGAKFSVTSLIDGNWVTLFSQTKLPTGALATQTVNLSAYAGKTLTMLFNTEAAGSPDYDWGAWTDARIIIDGAPGPIDGGCSIQGVSYPNGAVQPGVPCMVCNPVNNATDWSIRPDTCLIPNSSGINKCYDADQLDTLGCKKCDPVTSQTSWTDKSTCDKLIVFATPTLYKGGDLGGLAGADAKCAAAMTYVGAPGTVQAMLSTSTGRAFKDAVPSQYWSMPVVNLNGQQMYPSWDSIFSVSQVWQGIEGPCKPTSIGPKCGNGNIGMYTWTGSQPNGTYAQVGTYKNCQDWTSNGTLFSTYYARVGDMSYDKIVDSGITTNGAATNCTTARAITCVVTPTAPAGPVGLQVTVQNYDGTSLGPLQGKGQGNTYAYLGVPYAAPPTGSLRLAPPAKATAWTGVRSATNQPAPCAQPPLLPLGGMIGSEDCLYLNVWTPKTATPTSALPVLVFHHGGAHMFGGTKSSDDWLATGFIDGDRFAASQNAVVVTLQSRIGPLGYLTDAALAANTTSRTSTVGGGTSGNYGLLDTIQALKWIKRNISKFGGDPTKVAFSGESSGSTMVCDLLASPLTKDPADNKPYFTRAIMESGFCEGPSVAYRQAQATSAISSIGCGSAPDKVACLRSASLQSFVNVEGTILGFFPDMFASLIPPERAFGLTWGPHIDGYVLPQQPRLSFAAGTHNKMPVIVGTNKEEAMFVMLFMVGGILTGDLPNLIVLAGCGARDTKLDINLGTTLATATKSLYSCNSLDLLSPTKSFAEGVTHAQYECPARRTARALDIGQTEAVRRYWFTHRADHLGILQNVLGLVRDIGAAHSYELPYIFNTHGTAWYWPSSRERTLTTQIQSYWRSFANTGDPNYSGGANWPAYDRTLDNTLQLEVSGSPGGIQVVNGVDTAKCDFWDNNFTLDGWK